MMGRVSSIDAWQRDYRVVLIGSASGGVFKSTNGGVSFTPIFEHYGSQSIGDVAFFQGDTSIIWVGTGEATNRNSVGWGDGVYKSADGGATFDRMGLVDTRQIAEIATHPTNPAIVYVAALGALWGPSGSRGLYKTTDGGQSWIKLTNGLPDDGRTGATVVALDPSNPEIVFVGMYERLRTPDWMLSGGANGGLFKSTDGGGSFRKLTAGLPSGETGQIDVSIYQADPSIVFAYVEASDTLPHDLSVPGPGVYRSADGGETWRYLLRHNSRPYYHGRIRVDPSNPDNVYVIARDFAYSRDGGETWQDRRPWRSTGGDDHDMWIDPADGGIFYNATDQGAYSSVDGGVTTLAFNNMAIGQYYAIGVDMRDPYWVYGGLQDNGGWGLPSNSRDPRGIMNDHAMEINGGDGFHMQVDPSDWRTVYTTTHVGYFGRMNVETRERAFITPTPRTIVNFAEHYDPNYGESQTNYSINPGEYWLWSDSPQRTINGNNLPPQFRFNWNSPLVLSAHNPRTVFVGGNHLFESVDRGETWRIISPDLTTNDAARRNTTNSGGLTKDATGAENHYTIYTVADSPLDPAVIWVGTDDGNVQLTRDGGATWRNVRSNIPGVPPGTWVSRVEPSAHDVGTAYVAFDGHRSDDTNPYVFKTADFGATWTSISANLPREAPGSSIHTVVEDPVNPRLVFVGTEFGVYVTVDGGGSWTRFGDDLPSVAVRDLVIHPRDADLVAGTHGRSIWIADDIAPLRQVTDQVLAEPVHVFESRPGTKWLDFDKGRVQLHFKFYGGNPPSGAAVAFYLRAAPRDSVRVTVEDQWSGLRRAWSIAAHAGINRTRWDMRFDPTEAELAAYRAGLERVGRIIRERLPGTPREHLLQMQKDLLAPQNYPSLYRGVEYANREDALALLRRHMEVTMERLASARNVRQLTAARDQLIAFSQVVGDEAFFGIYGQELTMHEAAAGRYVVRISVDGRDYVGSVEVREDPLKR
jgi:photosystem II stability/assembly factor-like uncharacterized protein